MARPVLVRIAPSPTGYFHVGTARTAIYNYLFARQHGGSFVLRIEDTDLDRSEAQFVDVVLDGLNWLGIEWDEGPIHQADRQELYKPYVGELLASGAAYRCFCTRDDLEAERKLAAERKSDYRYSRRCRHLSDTERAERSAQGIPFAVRLAVPETGETTFDDQVAGRISKANEDIEDFVIARSDGRALYNFAVVVDDHLMEISHVIRGNDHISNTFKQVLIYRALGWEPPAFAHVPLILRADKGKISKRKGDPSVTEYRDMGYLPEALLNYLCLLGWSAGDDREIYTKSELVEAFDLGRVTGANPVFDPAKLEWMNGEYIRALEVVELARRTLPLFVAAKRFPGDGPQNRVWFESLIGLLQERCKILPDFVRQSNYFFEPPTDFDPKGVTKQFEKEGAPERLTQLARVWGETSPFVADNLNEATRTLAESEGTKAAPYIHVARLALTGVTAGPGLYELAALLGRDTCVDRLQQAAAAIAEGRVALRPPATEEK